MNNLDRPQKILIATIIGILTIPPTLDFVTSPIRNHFQAKHEESEAIRVKEKFADSAYHNKETHTDWGHTPSYTNSVSKEQQQFEEQQYGIIQNYNY